MEPDRFIQEKICVGFDQEPLLEKRSGCPDEFYWRDQKFRIVDVIQEWHDYRRKGKMAKNMRETHAETALRRGSWGVGKDYYRVRTENGRTFDIYYDRAPQNASHRSGDWFLYQEVSL